MSLFIDWGKTLKRQSILCRAAVGVGRGVSCGTGFPFLPPLSEKPLNEEVLMEYGDLTVANGHATVTARGRPAANNI